MAWIAVIIAFSSLPRSTLAKWNPGVAHGWGHFFEYGVLGWLWYRWRQAAGPGGWASIPCGILLAISVALLDEAYQGLIPGRVPSWLDAVVDQIGFIAGGVLAGLIAFRERRKQTA
jgi:VanZ family protein